MFFSIVTTSLLVSMGYFIYKYSETILQLLLVGINCSKIEKIKENGSNVFYVNTNNGKLFLNSVKIPTDVDIFYFVDKKVDIENQIMDKSDFYNLYGSHNIKCFTKYRDRLVTSFKTTQDINGTNKLCGYMDSYYENTIYMFKINAGDFDFDSIVNTYREEADDFDKSSDNESNKSSDNEINKSSDNEINNNTSNGDSEDSDMIKL